MSIDLPYGLPKRDIVRIAEQDDFSLIVMGTQGRGFFGEVLLGGVAYHVARRTDIRTLLIPPLR